MATKKDSSEGADDKKVAKAKPARKATVTKTDKSTDKPVKKAAASKAVKKAAKKSAKTAPDAAEKPEEAAEVAVTKPAGESQESVKETAGEAAKTSKPKAKAKPAKPVKKTPAPAGPKAGRGKKYLEALALIDREKLYPVDEAVTLVKQTSTTKFDATIEIHLKLGVDPRKAEQNIRGTVRLPAGTGKTLKVLAFVPDAQAAAAQKAGADFVADDAMKKKIAGGWAEFDVAVATPDQMTEVAKLGKVLGPKGLMPNPKAGTVNPKPAEAIAEVKKGTIEYRLAKDSTIHAGIGKMSFSESDLSANLKAYYRAILSDKPSDLKGTYVKSVTIAATMGPGIKLHAESLHG